MGYKSTDDFPGVIPASMNEIVYHAKMLLKACAIVALAGRAHAAASSCLPSWSKSSCQLFSESMDYLDRFYDPKAGYVFDPSSAAALRHDTRKSARYAVGLLARDQDDDVVQAMEIITNVVATQFKDPKDQWCVTVEEPTWSLILS